MSRPIDAPSTIGRYLVLEELGRGAMGVVYLADDPVLERKVAIKTLRKDLRLSDDEKALVTRRIEQEARAVARLAHPSIVLLHDLGTHPDLGAYLVFEHASGPTLEMVLRRGRLTRDGAARLAEELGAALSLAHERGVVHRDIKPANVILTEECAKIADFGVARLPESTLTRAGARVGTPAYSAPESIARGEHSPRSDQFSLAATLYEALSGTRAFPGQDTLEVARRIEREPPLPFATSIGYSSDVDAVLLRALSRDPEARFASAREFGLGLSAALRGVRKEQPTLVESPALYHPRATSSWSHRIGSAVLWFLIGATATVLVHRCTQGTEPNQARTRSDAVLER